MKNTKRVIAIVILASMLVSSVGLVGFTARAANEKYSDIEGHWAKTYINNISSYGLLEGYDGKFNPDDNMTRGQMAVVIDRIMGYKNKSSSSFSDLGKGYYKDAILKLNYNGIMNGYGSEIRPDNPITRQEAAVMLCRAFGIEENNGSSKLVDKNEFESWAKGYIVALESKGVISGDNTGRFKYNNTITRAEVVKMLDKIMPKYIMESGKVTGDSDGTTVIRSSNLTYDKATIAGDLILTEGCTGEITLSNITVKGKVIVNSDCKLKLRSSTVNTIEYNANNIGNIEVSSNSDVKIVNINNGGANIKGYISALNVVTNNNKINITGGRFKSINISNESNTIELQDTKVENLTVSGNAYESVLKVNNQCTVDRVSINSGNVKAQIDCDTESILIGTNGVDCELTLNSNAKSDEVTIDASDVKISNKGKVTRINAYGSDIKIESNNGRVYTKSSSSNVTVNNKKVKAGSTVYASSTSSSSSSNDDYDDDDFDWDDVEIDDVDIEDDNEIVVTLTEKLPNKLSKSAFSLENITEDENIRISDYDYITSGSKKYREYTLTLNEDLNEDDRYELTIELPNGDEISHRFYANGSSSSTKYPTISSVSTTRTSKSKATLKLNASTSGTIYYLIKDEKDTPTVSKVKNSGTSKSVSSGKNTITMSSSSVMDDEDKQYYVYIVSYKSSTSNVYGPYTINKYSSSSEDNNDTDNKNDTDNETDSKYSISDLTFDSDTFTVNLNKATTNALDKANIHIQNTSNNTNIDNFELSTDDNKVYKLKVNRDELTDGKYRILITSIDDKTMSVSSTITLDVEAVKITDLNYNRESSNKLVITFNSNKKGTVYYYAGTESITDVNELRNKKSMQIEPGENKIIVVNDNKVEFSIMADKSGNETSTDILNLSDI